MNNRTCTKCKTTLPATLEFFYKNARCKYGLTPRCKPCVNEDNIASNAKRDPAIVKAQANARAKKFYYKNHEKSKATARKSAAKARQDPEKYKKIQARKRAGGAGLTPEQIERIKLKQNNQCAICDTPNPTDLDHCHSSGTVRWLLCKHCNRGLGAFKDNPALLIKAANMLIEIRDTD